MMDAKTLRLINLSIYSFNTSRPIERINNNRYKTIIKFKNLLYYRWVTLLCEIKVYRLYCNKDLCLNKGAAI